MSKRTSRKLARRTNYMTGLSIWMIFLCIGFAIPSLIEGINVARNYQSFNSNGEQLTPGSYSIINYKINEASRVNIKIQSWNASGYWYDDAVPVTLAIMDDSTFTEWVLSGYPEPDILNATQFYHRSDIDVNNLDLGYDGSYYFVFYNTDVAITIELDIDIEIIPWGHIIAVSIVGLLFTVPFLTFGVKVLSTSHYIEEEKKDRKDKPVEDNEDEEEEKKKASPKKKEDDKDGTFCQSCGTPLTPKDGQYCPQCGASI